jgi:c-di-GMP-binding flagellar brake protein YcgR
MIDIDLECERRAHPRVSLTRPCKVYEPRSRKFLPGTTCNISAGGLLMRIERSLPVEPGDRLYVAIPHKRRDVFLRADEMLECRVVRALPMTSGETALAVQFITPPAQFAFPPQRRAAA